MNQRLIELAKQAGLKKEHGSDREGLANFDWPQFAELIVQECASIIESQDVDPAFRHRMSWAILKHFGDKE
jgi:hypothetical protein